MHFKYCTILLILIKNAVNCQKYKKIKIFNHKYVDECENVSTVLMEIIEQFFILPKIPFDIIVIGNSSQLSSVLNGIGKLNAEKFAINIKTPKLTSLVQTTKMSTSFWPTQSAVILVNSTSLFRKAIMQPNLRYQKPFKVLIYCLGQNLKTLKKSAVSNPKTDIRIGLNHYFLVNNGKLFELLTVERFKNMSNCHKPHWQTVNQYSKQILKWKHKLTNHKLYTSFDKCPVIFENKESNSSNYYHSQFHSQPQGIHADLIRIIGNMRNFSVTYHNGSENVRADVSFTEMYNDKFLSSDYKITTTFKQRDFVITVPPGYLFTNFEKLFWPFDHDTWMMLGITFGFAFAVIFVLNFVPKYVRDIVYGEGVRTPCLNILFIFFGFGQLRVPARIFSRVILLLFVFFCLIFRTCYQSKLFEFMTTDNRWPAPRTIQELIDKNFTIVIERNIRFFMVFSRILFDVR